MSNKSRTLKGCRKLHGKNRVVEGTKEREEEILKGVRRVRAIAAVLYLSRFICIPVRLHAIFRVSSFFSLPVSHRARRWNVFWRPREKHSSASTRKSHSTRAVTSFANLWYDVSLAFSSPKNVDGNVYAVLTGRRIRSEWYFTWNVCSL